MTARLVGAVLIGTVSLYTGGAVIGMWQRRVTQLTAFCRLLHALSDGIGTMGLPIQQIIGHFADTELERVGFLSAVRRIWSELPSADALSMAFTECLPLLELEAEERGLLQQFFAHLGSEDRAREGERCAYVHARLQTVRDEAASALPARCRIAKTLAGALGCAAALMLL